MGDSESTTKTEIPYEQKALYSGSTEGILEYQKQNPLTDFGAANPLEVAPLSGNQEFAAGMVPNMGAPTMTTQEMLSSPTIQAQNQAFKQLTQPTIQNQMSLGGLGRSTASADALALAAADQMVPVMESELARQERGSERQFGAAMEAGAMERDVEQQANEAELSDYLRRQDLAGNALYAPYGAYVPASLGSSTSSEGGMFK